MSDDSTELQRRVNEHPHIRRQLTISKFEDALSELSEEPEFPPSVIAEIERKLDMMRSGVDLDDPVGRHFAETFAGPPGTMTRAAITRGIPLLEWARYVYLGETYQPPTHGLERIN